VLSVDRVDTVALLFADDIDWHCSSRC